MGYRRGNLTHSGSTVIEKTQRVTYVRRDDDPDSREKGSSARHRPVPDLVDMLLTCWLVSWSNVSRATHTVWVECAPRRRVARSATVVLHVLANGLYRRRARDWDPGFRMRARSQESSTQAPRTRRLSRPDTPTRLVSLRLPYSLPAGARLPAPAYLPGG